MVHLVGLCISNLDDLINTVIKTLDYCTCLFDLLIPRNLSSFGESKKKYLKKSSELIFFKFSVINVGQIFSSHDILYIDVPGPV